MAASPPLGAVGAAGDHLPGVLVVRKAKNAMKGFHSGKRGMCEALWNDTALPAVPLYRATSPSRKKAISLAQKGSFCAH